MAGDIVVDAAEIRRAVPVVVRHELLVDEIGLADGVHVELRLEAELALEVGHHGLHVALAVAAHGRSERHVQNLATGLGGRAAGGHEETVRVVAVVVQNEFGPLFAQGCHEF